MSVSKVKVALGFLLTVSALGVGLGVSQHARPGGGHAGAGRVTTPGAREANGSQWPCEGPLAFGRYYAGGFRSMRGFEFRGISPLVNGIPVGGDFMLLNSIEYQLPIRARDDLYLVAFVDGGTVEPRIGITDYRLAAGFGLRIQLPILGRLPLALDFGFPINKAPGDNTQVFSFFIGFTR